MVLGIPNPERTIAQKVLSGFILVLAIYCFGTELASVAKVLGSQISLFYYTFNLLVDLALFLSSYGLWKGKPWGWWLAGVTCGTSALFTALPIVLFFVTRSHLPADFGMHGPALWKFLGMGSFWIAVFLAPLSLLFHPAVHSRFSKPQAKRVSRFFILVGTAFVLMVAIIGLGYAVMAYSFDEMRKPFPGESQDTFARGVGSIRDMKVSPDGRILACLTYPPGKGDDKLALVEIKSGKIKWLPLSMNRDHFLWSPDSRRMVVFEVAKGEATLLDVSSGMATRTIKLLTAHMAFHPDGSIWFIDFDGSLRRQDLDTGQSTRITEPRLPIQDFTLDARGSLAVVWGDAPAQSIRILDPSTGACLREWPVTGDPPVRALHFSLDGQKLFTLHWEGNGHKNFWIKIWNARTGEVDSIVDNLSPNGHSFEGIDFSCPAGWRA